MSWKLYKHVFVSVVISIIIGWIAMVIKPFMSPAMSIGVVGGADGPTAIFMASKMSGLLFNLINTYTILSFLFLCMSYPIVKKKIEKKK